MPNALADEARAMTDSELGEAINEAYREVFNLQFQRGTRQLQNPMAMRQARRQVARLRTILRERQLAEAAGTPIEPLARVADAEPGNETEEVEEPAETVDQLDGDAGSEEE
ncbi:MAG: 50S ribosomal protein L29 [Chloroflexota bacterium]|nr:50S ribosomal protein L29 [Chloroflexota bacterium]MDE2893935.1 50S ribosomal protein L29 [Chloroflexota bacterium]